MRGVDVTTREEYELKTEPRSETWETASIKGEFRGQEGQRWSPIKRRKTPVPTGFSHLEVFGSLCQRNSCK